MRLTTPHISRFWLSMWFYRSEVVMTKDQPQEGQTGRGESSQAHGRISNRGLFLAIDTHHIAPESTEHRISRHRTRLWY